MQDYNAVCGRRFRDERERLGLTQSDVHRATGIAKHTVVAYESGASILFIRHKEALEKLGFDLQFVYFGRTISPRFDFASLFDITLQVILHMQDQGEGIDRSAAIEILRAVFASSNEEQTSQGKTAKAMLTILSAHR
jgi:transcriptional regulator with XRE-family HTH domain